MRERKLRIVIALSVLSIATSSLAQSKGPFDIQENGAFILFKQGKLQQAPPSGRGRLCRSQQIKLCARLRELGVPYLGRFARLKTLSI